MSLIRFARRNANWEEPLPSAQDLIAGEFTTRDGKPDLAISVYEVFDKDETLRAYAEHAHRIEPPRTATGIDIARAAPRVEATAGDTPFAFTKGRHREVVLENRQSLVSFVENLRPPPGPQAEKIEQAKVYGYVRDRLSAGDEEWEDVADAEGAKKWVKKLAAEVRSKKG